VSKPSFIDKEAYMKSSLRRAAIVSIATGLTLNAALAAGSGVTIPQGTAVDLVLVNALDSTSAKAGDPFRATLARALYVDGQLALAEGTTVKGHVDTVKSLRNGARSGFIRVKFDHITLPGAQETVIDGNLTSLRQDDRRRIVELAPKVSTGRKIDVVLIGSTSKADARAHTLVGDDLAADYSQTALSETEVDVAAGSLLSMEFDAPLTVSSPKLRGATADQARRIYVATATVTAAQRALRHLDYYRGEADGVLGTTTRNAIVRFQLDRDQVATGDLDEGTLRLLELPSPPQQ
jgi:hypothetical protein